MFLLPLRTLELEGDRLMSRGEGAGLVVGGRRGIMGSGYEIFRLLLVGTFLMEEPRGTYIAEIANKAKTGESRPDGDEVDPTQERLEKFIGQCNA
ncbi:unnamed protein product [Cuscuta europaea]|uniref:Uncharacterized protein n=1 Tax=Cuscuta europaea TaxID=41803 RepID=A0A9P0Z3Z1_CUSEU|nr:unnamed protein product [Cuscuta europaea]